MPKQIATHLFNPRGSVFKDMRSKRAEIHRYFCSLEGECPVLAQGKCIQRDLFTRCMYGNQSTEQGPTTRAAAFSKFIDKGREEMARIPDVGYASTRICYVGEYVYLPYGQMNHSDGGWEKDGNLTYGHKQEALPFVQNSNFMASSVPFMKRELFDVEMIRRIVNFRPQALMGGEITSYQKEDVPAFLRDLRAYDRELYRQAVEKYPQIADRIPNNKVLLGKHALLTSLPSGKVRYGSHTYEWEPITGTLTTGEDIAFMTPDPVKYIVYPASGMKVELCDEAMVNQLPDNLMLD